MLCIRGLSKPFIRYKQTQFSLAPCFCTPKAISYPWSLENQVVEDYLQLQHLNYSHTPCGALQGPLCVESWSHFCLGHKPPVHSDPTGCAPTMLVFRATPPVCKTERGTLHGHHEPDSPAPSVTRRPVQLPSQLSAQYLLFAQVRFSLSSSCFCSLLHGALEASSVGCHPCPVEDELLAEFLVGGVSHDHSFQALSS